MKRPLIMGIVNVTPDSFSDGGSFLNPDLAISHGLKLIEDGADILDIGGESTRPGAESVSVEKEINRVVPVIKGLAGAGRLISIDTRHREVMKAALEAGAALINDISALQDKGAVELATDSGAAICLMHMQGSPETMQNDPEYGDVVKNVFSFLEQRIKICVAAGISKDKIYSDVGIGFGKTLEHNLDLLRNLKKFQALGVKTLLGTSRKKFIGALSNNAAPDKRLGGSLATVLWGAEQGVDIVRVHDVFETRQALDIWFALKTGQ